MARQLVGLWAFRVGTIFAAFMTVVMVMLQEWRGAAVAFALLIVVLVALHQEADEDDSKGFPPLLEAALGLVLGVGGVVQLVRGESLDGALLLIAGCGLMIVAVRRFRKSSQESHTPAIDE